MLNVEAQTQTELEAAAFRRLVAHLREHTEVQNIDLMNLAGFCRNCLAKWLKPPPKSRVSRLIMTKHGTIFMVCLMKNGS